MPRTKQPRIIFITGTDTGIGKTVLTALLLSHLRQTGCLALKPFCSGGRADGELLHSLQNDDLTLDEINPFYFSEPLAPLVAARNEGRHVPFDIALHHVRAGISLLSKIKNRKSKIENSTLLIEGAGGLLSPLGEPKSASKVQGSCSYSAIDLIKALNSRVILVAPNRLGTINHTLLSVIALQSSRSHQIKVVLMDINDQSSSPITHHASPSPSRNTQHATRSNPSILTELLSPIPIFPIPNLGKNPSKPEQIRTFAKKYKKTLAEILA